MSASVVSPLGTNPCAAHTERSWRRDMEWMLDGRLAALTAMRRPAGEAVGWSSERLCRFFRSPPRSEPPAEGWYASDGMPLPPSIRAASVVIRRRASAARFSSRDGPTLTPASSHCLRSCLSVSSHMLSVLPPRNCHAARFCASASASSRAWRRESAALAAASSRRWRACAAASVHSRRWAERNSKSADGGGLYPQRGQSSSKLRTKSFSACLRRSSSLIGVSLRAARCSLAADASRCLSRRSCSALISARISFSTRGGTWYNMKPNGLVHVVRPHVSCRW
mmetsp:Transcript_4432/g.10825  ORF Transcript_4432/g.10825 Transcript_4432/m.10825 type:complete len:281 (-) Transcript_4432:234-1076(-)